MKWENSVGKIIIITIIFIETILTFGMHFIKKDEGMHFIKKDEDKKSIYEYVEYKNLVIQQVRLYNQQENIANEKIDKIISLIITPQMNVVEKEIAVHNWICDNVTYDYKKDGKTPKYLDREKTPSSNYYTLTTGKAVCSGYSLLFKSFMDRLGIETLYIVGYGYNNGEWLLHAWNQIYYNGLWLNIDVTWDDTTNDMEYFNKVDKDFKDHLLLVE